MILKKLRHSFIGALLMVGLVGGVVGATVPMGTAQAACGQFLTFPAWYEGIADPNTCEIQSPGQGGDELSRYIWTIALNVLEIVLQLVGYLAVIFMLFAGFKYMTSEGSPDTVAQALKSIINASVGLVIALSAIALKNFIWTLLAGGQVNEYGVYEVDPQSVLEAGLNSAYFVAGAIAVIMMVISGITYISSSGNATSIAKAKKTMLYAVIGLGVVVAAWAITNFIAGWF